MSAHTHDLSRFRHSHAFADSGMQRRERALTLVTLITLAAMAGELAAGWWSGSLALLADGWHMGTHALALGGAVLAYKLSARAATHRAVAGGSAGFAFGGWKIEVLAAYTSGLLLMGVALFLVADAIAVLRAPRPIAYAEALGVAVIGLGVNLLSAWLLSRGAGNSAPANAAPAVHQHPHAAHEHEHEHEHEHGHGHGHAHHGHGHGHDHNFSAAYLHVLADAFTSVLAIAALAGGWWWGWAWLDPAVALLGAVVIGQWSFSVLKSSSRALVDATEDPTLTQRIRDLLEADGDAKVSDLHVWQVGAQAWSAALSVVADAPLPAADYRDRLADIATLRHVTVEVHRCDGSA
jgi:cation diffusion facilitator family transporter